MSHLDEGLIHELLDGELSPGEARAARSHLVTCAECRARYEEARDFFAESERLVKVLDSGQDAASRLPGLPPSRLRRSLPLRPLAWAASIFLAISLGYYGSDFKNRPADKLAEGANLAATPAKPPENVPVVAEPSTPPPAAVTRQANPERQKRAGPEAQPQRLDQAGRVAPSESPADARAENEAGAAGGRVAGQSGISAELRPTAPADQAAPAQEPAALSAADAMNVAAKVVAPTAQPAFRQIPMEEGVRLLGGTIRLIEGLTPDQLKTGSGQLVTGARPDLIVVRVVYLDPPRRELWLDQQHGTGPTTAAPDTILVPNPNGAQSLQWHPASGEWLSLTGFLTADSLKALARRVR